MQKSCPVCAAPGQDLVFKFECTNPECQNFVMQAPPPSEPQESDENDEEDEYGQEWMGCSD